jgi:hypothetical protein
LCFAVATEAEQVEPFPLQSNDAVVQKLAHSLSVSEDGAGTAR